MLPCTEVNKAVSKPEFRQLARVRGQTARTRNSREAVPPSPAPLCTKTPVCLDPSGFQEPSGKRNRATFPLHVTPRLEVAARPGSCLCRRRTSARGRRPRAAHASTTRKHRGAEGGARPAPRLVLTVRGPGVPQPLSGVPLLKHNPSAPGRAPRGRWWRAPRSRPAAPSARPVFLPLTDVLHHHRVVHRDVDGHGAPRVEDGKLPGREGRPAVSLAALREAAKAGHGAQHCPGWGRPRPGTSLRLEAAVSPLGPGPLP